MSCVQAADVLMERADLLEAQVVDPSLQQLVAHVSVLKVQTLTTTLGFESRLDCWKPTPLPRGPSNATQRR